MFYGFECKCTPYGRCMLIVNLQTIHSVKDEMKLLELTLIPAILAAVRKHSRIAEFMQLTKLIQFQTLEEKMSFALMSFIPRKKVKTWGNFHGSQSQNFCGSFNRARPRSCLALSPFHFKGKFLGKQPSVCCRSLSGTHASPPACRPHNQGQSYVIQYLTSREHPAPC